MTRDASYGIHAPKAQLFLALTPGHFEMGDNFEHFWTSHVFFWGRSIACIIFIRKTPSRADFQWCLKVWILMQTDSFAYSHLGIGPLIFIYYSPWQHVQSVCRFPSSFTFQWLGRLLLVVLLSAGIKEKHWTESLRDCSCRGKMCIHFTLVGLWTKASGQPNSASHHLPPLRNFLLLLFQASSLNQTNRCGNGLVGQSCILQNWQGQIN